MEETKKVIYIDEEAEARETYTVTLQDWFGEEVTVEAIDPLLTLDEMRSYLAEQKNLVSLVLDQRLNLKGTANYQGSELADSCRTIFPDLPIYIFTNHAEDFESEDNPVGVWGPGTVEYILSKGDTTSESKDRIISARLRRHISQFCKIERDRDERLLYLLNQKIQGTLTQEENDELSKINDFRMRPILMGEALGVASLKSALDENERILNDLEQRLAEL